MMGTRAYVLSTNAWIDESTKKTLLTERRRTSIQLLENSEYYLVIDLELSSKETVTLGKTPFGIIGVRVAKTMGTMMAVGRFAIRRKVNEAQVLWEAAKWVDYSGPITNKTVRGSH